jgi:hypothetical protein
MSGPGMNFSALGKLYVGPVSRTSIGNFSHRPGRYLINSDFDIYKEVQSFDQVYC